ncbi:hypothetical protein Scep_017361 [Stephania cephalantha]|uniref:Uncharacterized protein n=1 Tax=Stephania cephalantha TaxID=152367 RepID=A0AAP0IQR8_9MAGN
MNVQTFFCPLLTLKKLCFNWKLGYITYFPNSKEMVLISFLKVHLNILSFLSLSNLNISFGFLFSF